MAQLLQLTLTEMVAFLLNLFQSTGPKKILIVTFSIKNNPNYLNKKNIKK